MPSLGACDQNFLDFNAGYQRKLSIFAKRLDWSPQLNVNNVFDNDKFVRRERRHAGQLPIQPWTDC